MADVGEGQPERLPGLRPSGYVSRWEEFWYGLSGPFYDALVWWCFLPLGGERPCRRAFVDWLEVGAGHAVLSLCCGTGTQERALLDLVPDARITGIDLGTGQVATARRKGASLPIDYRVGDASDTGLPTAHFDRVLVCLALHEMPRALRLAVLREAARLCKPEGRVLAVEHARVESRASAVVRALWWFAWLPGNPEVATTRDLQRRGLANEMGEAGLHVLERHATRPEWIEGVLAAPAPAP